MVRKQSVPLPPAAQAIRAQVLRGIALDRNAKFHFPGYFLGLEWPSITVDGVHMAIADGPHCRDANGSVDVAAMAILADMALATTARLGLAAGTRLATVRMEIRFTGAPATGRISADARLLGFSQGTALRQSLSSATLHANNEVIAYASGEFVVLDTPPGVKLVPLPWEHETPSRIDAVDEEKLQPYERAILKACDAALARTSTQAAFIQHFWGGVPKRRVNGASNRVIIGPHLANRVGHVQGGIMFGMAAASACAAAPATMMLSSASACFISAGRGKALRVASRVVHAGRTIAVVRTELTAYGGARVLEVVTHHVAKSH